MRVDRDEICERLGGDEELLCELAGVFIDSGTQLLGRLSEAMKSLDFANLGRAAHSLKGSASVFNLTEIVDATTELEQTAKGCEAERASVLVCRIKQQIQEVVPIFASFAGKASCES